MKIDPNSPAFPNAYFNDVPGLTIRAHLAALAMQGLLANLAEIRRYDHFKDADIAQFAVMQADSLIAELNKEASK